MAAIKSANSECTASHHNNNGCSCPKRQEPPQKPRRLPLSCVPENNDKMRGWLLQRYASSPFNTCPHQTLPTMDGPTVETHLDETATPRACRTAAWQTKFYQDLLRDEALGVIEHVSYGEPATWCHRMVVTRKQDGTPRRTVDLSTLNRRSRSPPNPHSTLLAESQATHGKQSPTHGITTPPRSTIAT